MCLVTKSPIQIASKAICCYKVLLPTGKKTFRPPFYSAEYTLGELKTVECFTNEFNRQVTTGNPSTINQGLHAFVSLQEARSYRASGEVIVQCQIPKGTAYARGQDHDIVALALLPLKKVASFERKIR